MLNGIEMFRRFCIRCSAGMPKIYLIDENALRIFSKTILICQFGKRDFYFMR